MGMGIKMEKSQNIKLCNGHTNTHVARMKGIKPSNSLLLLQKDGWRSCKRKFLILFAFRPVCIPQPSVSHN